MANLVEGVKKLSFPMFFIFVVSKLFVGLGLGILLYKYLAPYGWPLLAIGAIASLVCVLLAAKKV